MFLATRTAELFCERAAGIAGVIWEKFFPLDSKQKQVLAHCLLNDQSNDLVFLNLSPAAHMSTDYFVLEEVNLISTRDL
ncbi:hypothetical protein [Synechococcus lacustris]|uniref:hypothetical protein n=1 Tax=Synechococcus lacustris TaxID=2116544 RepID=UPI0020CEBA21|nr:hypothetical protein [Synechococcus lacustris]